HQPGTETDHGHKIVGGGCPVHELRVILERPGEGVVTPPIVGPGRDVALYRVGEPLSALADTIQKPHQRSPPVVSLLPVSHPSRTAAHSHETTSQTARHAQNATNPAIRGTTATMNSAT